MSIFNLSSFMLFNKYLIIIIMLVRQLSRLYRTAQIQHLHRFLFCSSLKQLSDSAQKAVWAKAIIQRISHSKLSRPQNYDSKTLSQLVLQMDHPQGKKQTYKFDEKNKDEVMSMFKTGIKLDLNIYNQSRIDGAKQKNTEKTKFFPNFIVTPQIFDTLQQQRFIDTIIYGGFGISKTFSIIFYKILLEYTTKFWMQAKNDEKKKGQKENLIKQGLLNQSCWKYWYWTLHPSLIEEMLKFDYDPQHVLKTQIRDIILLQAVQLSDEEKQGFIQIDSFEQFSKKLKSHYQNAGINSRPIIDQINSVASKMRQCNAIKKVRFQQEAAIFKQRYQAQLNYLGKPNVTDEQTAQYIKKKDYLYSKDRYSIQKFQRSKFHKWIKPTQKLLQIVQSFKKIGKSYVFNSSLNIQLDLLSDKAGDHLFNFKSIVDNHKEFNKVYIKYQEYLTSTIWGRIDFWKFFQNQLSKRLDESKISKQIKCKITQSLRKIFQKLPIHTYYRPVYTRQFLDKSYKLRTIKSEKAHIFQQLQTKRIQLVTVLCDTQTQLEVSLKTLNQLMNMFEVYCKARCTQNINSFIYDKGSQEQITFKLKFIQFLFHIAKQKKKIKDSIMKFDSRIFIKLFKLLGYDINQFLYSRLHNKEFLPIEFSQSCIQFAWTVQQFLQIAQPVIFRDINNFISDFWTQGCKRQLSQDQRQLGNIFQRYLLEALQSQSQLKLKFFRQDESMQNNPSDTDQTKDELGRVCFKIKDVCNFKPYNLNFKDNKINSKLENLQQSKTSADKNLNQYIVGKPKYNDKHSFTSKAIDFIILKGSKSGNNSWSYDLYLFDPTVSFINHDKFKDKNQKLIVQIRQSFLQKKLKCKLTYVVICVKKLCSQQGQKNQINLETASIDDLQITSVDKVKELTFRLIQKLVTVSYELNLEKTDKTKKRAQP